MYTIHNLYSYGANLYIYIYLYYVTLQDNTMLDNAMLGKCNYSSWMMN